ncbi:MAG TPA: hypothetical protein PKE20_11890, partial [Promineifilum sp.]|nr:hypothetical protein [Promineifilum sp.]
WRRRPVAGGAAAVALASLLVWWVWANRPFVLSITRDNSRQAIVETAGRIRPDPNGRPITVQTPWGTDYWALTYEQAYGGRLTGLSLVDHNARPQDILARADRLVVPDQTFRPTITKNGSARSIWVRPRRASWRLATRLFMTKQRWRPT